MINMTCTQSQHCPHPLAMKSQLTMNLPPAHIVPQILHTRTLHRPPVKTRQRRRKTHISEEGHREDAAGSPHRDNNHHKLACPLFKEWTQPMEYKTIRR